MEETKLDQLSAMLSKTERFIQTIAQGIDASETGVVHLDIHAATNLMHELIYLSAAAKQLSIIVLHAENINLTVEAQETCHRLGDIKDESLYLITELNEFIAKTRNKIH